MLSSGDLLNDPRNHSVPVLDLFPDDQDPSISYMVMPFLRDPDDPELEKVSDVIDLIDQVLEVFVFVITL